MTSDNLEATLIDDSLFGDIFTMQSQFLDDFEFGLEANNIDTLLELFEEEEKRCETNTNKICNNVFKNNSEVNQNERNDNIFMISLPKVRKSTTNSPDVSTKRKGTSLLAKPKKSSAKRSLLNINDRDFHSISSYLLQDHDYCQISKDDNKLYNKLPDYITEFSNISKSITSNTCSSNESFDKIPNYLKGFLNINDNNIDKSQDFITNNENILIELNEAYIEVSDVVFDNDLYSDDKNDCEVYSEEFNSESSNYSTNMSSEETKELKDILSEKKFLPQNDEQNDSNNYNRNDSTLSTRRSRSRSREQRNPKFVKKRTQRRRRLSTRSSVDSKSDSSSCSSCDSCDSFSSLTSEESNVNFELSNSIIRNESNGQPLSKKRSLKESYCQKNFEPKVRNNCNKSVFNVKNGNSITINTKKDIEERKIIYVGKIPDGTTKTDIRYWFGQFGAIKEVSIHFRDRGDNYAFVTFHRRTDAFQAIEHANDDSRHPKFDLSFGGRRQFCKTRYEDLDFAEDNSSFSGERMDFDSLLRSTQAKLNR